MQYQLRLRLTNIDSVRYPGSKALEYSWFEVEGGEPEPVHLLPCTPTVKDSLLIYSPIPQPDSGAELLEPTLTLDFTVRGDNRKSPLREEETVRLKQGVAGSPSKDLKQWIFKNPLSETGLFEFVTHGPEFMFSASYTDSLGQRWIVDPQMNVKPPDVIPLDDKPTRP